MSASLRRIGPSLLSLSVLFAAWETASRSGVVNALLFPPPTKVFAALWQLTFDGTLPGDALVSIWRVLAGIVIGSAAGIAAGLLTGRIVAIDRVLSPVIHLLRPLPPVAIIPLVIVWFGIGDAGKIFSISLAVFFPVWLSAHTGARSVMPEYLWSAALLTRSRVILFTRVIFPAALPFVAAGIRTAVAIAFIMVFVSELAGAESGLGYRISITQLAYRVDQMMAGLGVLAALSALFDLVIRRASIRLFPWLP